MFTIDHAFLQWGIPLPPKPLEHNRFTRWGKNGRYSATRLDEGVYVEDFVTGEKLHWFPEDKKTTLTPKKRKEHQEAIAKAKQAMEQEMACRYADAAKHALSVWERAGEVTTHPYLQQKKVEAFGLRQDGTSLLIPLRDIEGKLCSLQTINLEAKLPKTFFRDAKKKGCFHPIGTLENRKPFFVTEGYATGASVHIATGLPVVVAFDAGNLEPVIAVLRNVYPDSIITIAADNDQWGEVNTGRLKAEEAARKHGCNVVWPEFSESIIKQCKANGLPLPTDWNDKHVWEGL